MELSIDTSWELASIALAREGKVQAEITWHAGRNHTAQLIPAIEFLLQQGEVPLEGIKALMVAQGPGSFNGLRVGMSTVKGLAYALRIPVVGVGTLDIEAFPYAYSGYPVRPIIDMARGEVATALFQRQGNNWLKLEAEHIAAWDAVISQMGRDTIVCGRLSDSAFGALEERLGSQVIVARHAPPRGAGSLAMLGWQRMLRGEMDDPVTLQPIYLRRPSITQRKANNSLETEVKL